MGKRTILVSGGSRGLGLAMVRHLLEKGHNVATFARNETISMGELLGSFPQNFRFGACDSRDVVALGGFLSNIEQDLGPVYGLVNNAAIGQDNLLVHLNPQAIHDLLMINVEAPILLTRLVLRRMLIGEEGGRIVNIGSICGLRGFQGLTVYSATKGAMDAFTRSLAREVGVRGILVNTIAPGFFESDMSRVLAPAQLESIRRRTATGKMTEEDQIMPILDLLLFADTNATGQTFVVDGGAIA